MQQGGKLSLDYLMGLRAKAKSAAYMHKIGWESAVSVVRPARTRDAGKDDARCSTSHFGCRTLKAVGRVL